MAFEIAVVAVTIALYFGVVYLTARKRVPIPWLMGLLALVIAILSGLGLTDIYTMLTEGASLQYLAIFQFFFGAMFAVSMIETGLVNTMIKKAIELGGERPFVTVAIIMAVWGYLATALVGMSGTVAVGSITIPVMLGLGISAGLAAVFHDLGIAIGFAYWVPYYSYYQTISGVSLLDHPEIALTQLIISVIVVYIFIAYAFKRDGLRFRWSASNNATPEEGKVKEKKVKSYAFITPAIPVVLIVLLGVPLIPAFLIGIIACWLLTWPGQKRRGVDWIGIFEETMIHGIITMAPLVAIMIGAGWLIRLGRFSQVQSIFSAVITPLGLSGPIAFVATFAILIAVAVYRGFGNLWGLGALIYTVLGAMKVFPPIALTAGLLAQGIMLMSVDPTTGNVIWTTNYAKAESTQTLTYRGVGIFIWVASIAAVIIAAIRYF